MQFEFYLIMQMSFKKLFNNLEPGHNSHTWAVANVVNRRLC